MHINKKLLKTAVRDDKQAPDSADRSPVGLDTLSCSTLESVVRPNTATDPREGQYRMGLDPSGYEKQQAQGSTASQPDKFDLFSSTLSPSDPNQEGKFNSPLQQQHTFFASEFPSLVDRITPPDIFIQLDHFDGTPMAHSARDQWLQEGVAPAAVQPDVLETKPSTSVAVSSPSSTSSSSKASSTRVAAAAAPATSAAAAGATLGEKKEREDIHSKTSFSGGPSCLPSSIAEARKRSKQMPYSAPTDSANPGGLNNNSNSNGAAAAPGGAGVGGGGGGVQD
ncbi:hypothetical protein PTTG_03813 [Puccinia triticina 1-1 BBBD Race 1]|uniref:Uncharacterized protein n=1 Tax=Puccinia triticina (isolate 1-1 / race 1 (BBBD)) TaxID=630390 RepID=A0A180GPE9_PUCT1|nr:hypothetical protein PTTG_03813 [Puccinia triticina 1-1 BBBD Race 1]